MDKRRNALWDKGKRLHRGCGQKRGLSPFFLHRAILSTALLPHIHKMWKEHSGAISSGAGKKEPLANTLCNQKNRCKNPLLVAGIDIGVQVFNDLGHLRVRLREILYPFNGVHDRGVVAPFKFLSNFLE